MTHALTGLLARSQLDGEEDVLDISDLLGSLLERLLPVYLLALLRRRSSGRLGLSVVDVHLRLVAVLLVSLLRLLSRPRLAGQRQAKHDDSSRGIVVPHARSPLGLGLLVRDLVVVLRLRRRRRRLALDLPILVRALGPLPFFELLLRPL